MKALLIVYLLTFGSEGAYFALWGFPDLNAPNSLTIHPYLILSLILMWIPGITALFFAKREGIRLKILQKPDWMLLKTGIAATGLSFFSLVFSMPFNQWNETSPLYLALSVGGLFLDGLVFMPFITLGEEIFWRGYLHEKMKHLGMFKASFLIGIAWGIWHAPMIFMGHNFPGYPFLGAFFMCLLCITGSPLFFWFREQGKSILVPAVFHAMLNNFSFLGLILFKNPNPFFSGSGIGSLIGLSLLSAAVLLRENRKTAQKAVLKPTSVDND